MTVATSTPAFTQELAEPGARVLRTLLGGEVVHDTGDLGGPARRARVGGHGMTDPS